MCAVLGLMRAARSSATLLADRTGASEGTGPGRVTSAVSIRVIWRPGLLHVWALLPVIAAALGSALQPLEPIDYWWGVRLGDLIRATGTIPAGDTLIYTPLRGPVVDGQWLAKVLLSYAHQVGGVEVALALRSLVAITIALLLVSSC